MAPEYGYGYGTISNNVVTLRVVALARISTIVTYDENKSKCSSEIYPTISIKIYVNTSN